MTTGALKVRVIAVLCPVCKGSGVFPLSWEFACTWCKGKKRVDLPTACHYADVSHDLAFAGYLAGDHDLPYAREMEAKAQAIYDFVGVKAPWNKP